MSKANCMQTKQFREGITWLRGEYNYLQLAENHDGYQLAPFILKNRELEQKNPWASNAFLFLTLVPPEPGESS